MALQLRIKKEDHFDCETVRKLTLACEAASELCKVSYRVPVYLFPVPVFVGRDAFNVGYFKYSGTLCSIELAAARPINDILSTLAHELVHLEQWLDGDDPLDVECEEEAQLREREICKAIKKSIRGK